jgi:hypothetical protein
MDPSLEPAKEWKPQIEANLRKSKAFIVLFSSKSVQSDWVKHEGSMAFALEQLIIPVNLEKPRKYTSRDLPIWAKEYQLYNLFDGSADYEDQYQRLKQLLGEPLPIRRHLLEMIQHYKESGMLLDEVALALIERHQDDLNLTKGDEEIANRLIEESRFKLESYWIRYDKLLKAYNRARTEELNLKQLLQSKHSENAFYRLLTVGVIGILILHIVLVAYVFLRIMAIFQFLGPH